MVAGRRTRKEQWSDWVPKDSSILFDVELTPTNRLRKMTAEHLKREYAALLNANQPVFLFNNCDFEIFPNWIRNKTTYKDKQQIRLSSDTVICSCFHKAVKSDSNSIDVS